MSSDIRWVDDLDGSDLAEAGGKAASLGELTAAGVNVPPAFVVTTASYRRFIQASGIEEELAALVEIDVDDASQLTEAATRASELITGAELPAELREEIMTAYGDLGDGEEFVAVRSSATAEDQPDASFAGQQETFLNVRRGGLIHRIRECWASLFTPRAIYYRAEQGFDSPGVNMAVVVQRMVQADVSGVLFTNHPSAGDGRMVIEAAWGLGEAVVSGEVSPDTYLLDAETGDVQEVNVATKRTMVVRDEDDGETVQRAVPEERQTERVLDDETLGELCALGRRIEDHYGDPQDIEWAIEGGEVYVLQSRPITTLPDEDPSGVSVEGPEGDEADGETLLSGIGASPGRATGPVRIVEKLDQLDKVAQGDLLVTKMTTPDMVPAMKRAAGIITDEGGMTSHASIVSRELGVPAVVGTSTATTVLADGQRITIDGERGVVYAGREPDPGDPPAEPTEGEGPPDVPKPMTATRIKVNVSIPEAASRAAATGADGVGLLRIEHLVLSLGKTPTRYITDHGEKAYIDELVTGIQTVADAFYPSPVRVRTLDAPTDEFRELVGGEDEPHEHNPMLGYRGIRRSLDRPEAFEAELAAFARLYEMGYDNIELMLPLVSDASEVEAATAHIEAAGIDLNRRTWGVMIESPASALRVEELVATGIDFASFGTNDLTQYTLAVDRNNPQVADLFDELHPAVLDLIEMTIETCRAHDVQTSICGQAGSNPRMIKFLVEQGVSSISANIDAVRAVQAEVKRVEQRLMLDAVR